MEVTTNCPNCNNENRAGAKFCKNCGYSIGESKSPVKFCPKCKNPNRSSAKFCCVCGHSFIELTFAGPLSQGTILVNRYEIISLIKSGGMGSVYKARDHRMLEPCAIKELIATFTSEKQQEYSIKRFNEEGKILANLAHPNLPKVTDLFVERGRYYLVMDFIEGEDLDSCLKAKKIPLEEDILKYSIQILEVLDYLHSQNPPILYRDVKPANIMIRTRDQRAMLIDFGIARTLEEEEGKRTKIGTPQYSPMEQFKGMVEPRSDIYSLGATMHHLITGIQPAPMAFQFEPITKLKPQSKKELEEIITKATQSDVNDRYTSAREMLDSLKNMGEKTIIKPSLSASPVIKDEEKTETETISPAGISSEEEKIQQTVKTDTGEETAPPVKKSSRFKKAGPIDIHPSSTEMIFIPAGYFWMGDTSCDYEAQKGKNEPNRKGQHRVNIEAFYMDKTPVTNQQYKVFIEETGYKSEGDWEKYFTSDKENHPVVNVTWYDADSYAKWAKKRLPSEGEWEKASRGSDGRNWPWGNLWDKSKVNSKEKGPGTTTDVNNEKGASVYGILDTVGNVWEWTSDWYFPYPYEGPYITKEGDKKAIRGGSFAEGKDKCNCYSRTWGFPENKSSFRGFRCALDS